MDSTLISRINKYLNDNEDQGKHTYLDNMVEDLRLKYKEYGRRQKCAFRNLVNRTWKCMEEEEEENEIINVDEDQSSYMETIQKNMYNSPKRKSTTQSPVIDLCNDEESAERIKKMKKKRKLSSLSNGTDIKNDEMVKNYYQPKKPKMSLENFIGYREVINSLIELISSKNPSRCILLCGPKGCGKTSLVEAFAAEINVNLIRIYGASDIPDAASVRELFHSARMCAPCILLLDKLEDLCLSKKGSTDIVSQLCSSIDGIMEDKDGKDVIIIGATSFPDSVDENLTRPGRFEISLSMNLPDKSTRYELLKSITRNMCSKLVLDEVALATPGYVANDLENLVTYAIAATASRKDNFGVDSSISEGNANPITEKENGLSCEVDLLKQESNPSIHLEIGDFEKALKCYKQLIMREGYATDSKVTWDTLGSLKDIRRKLESICINAVKNPEDYKVFGIERPVGILLYGPPGCGKTSIAKAIANEANLNFLSVNGPEILNKYLGESERSLRRCFDRARSSKPCIIFFDEIDALCSSRSSLREGNNVSNRLVAQMLTEMDGTIDRTGIYIMGATNCPNKLDEAIMRPGRFDEIIYVGVPSAEDRVDILKTLTKVKPPLKDVDFDIFCKDPSLDGFTGADLSRLVEEATAITARNHREYGHELVVTMDTFYEAVRTIKPSVSPEDKAMYERMRDKFERKNKS